VVSLFSLSFRIRFSFSSFSFSFSVPLFRSPSLNRFFLFSFSFSFSVPLFRSPSLNLFFSFLFLFPPPFFFLNISPCLRVLQNPPYPFPIYFSLFILFSLISFFFFKIKSSGSVFREVKRLLFDSFPFVN